MQSPKDSHIHPLELGLKALKLVPDKDQPPSDTSCNIETSDMLSSDSLSSSSSLVGDYIGMESCHDLKDNEVADALKKWGEADQCEASDSKCRGKRDCRRRGTKKKEFPPPIPLLARTENLSCHMPWVLKRYYTSDGRLILTEEKVKRHEYFRAERADGRLTLQLIPLDYDVSPLSSSDDGDGENEESYSCENGDTDDGGSDGDDDGNGNGDYMNEDDDDVEEEIFRKDRTVDIDDSMTNNGSGGKCGNGAGKCLTYSNVNSGSSCMFGVPVPAIRTVHS